MHATDTTQLNTINFKQHVQFQKFPTKCVGSRRELVGNAIHAARRVKTPKRRDETRPSIVAWRRVGRMAWFNAGSIIRFAVTVKYQLMIYRQK